MLFPFNTSQSPGEKIVSIVAWRNLDDISQIKLTFLPDANARISQKNFPRTVSLRIDTVTSYPPPKNEELVKKVSGFFDAFFCSHGKSITPSRREQGRYRVYFFDKTNKCLKRSEGMI